MSKYLVTGELDYVQGHLRNGHKELIIEKDEWDSMTKEEQIETLVAWGELIVDDYSVEDVGDFYKITKEDYKPSETMEELE